MFKTLILLTLIASFHIIESESKLTALNKNEVSESVYKNIKRFVRLNNQIIALSNSSIWKVFNAYLIANKKQQVMALNFEDTFSRSLKSN